MPRRRPPEPPPESEDELLHRARVLAGRTVDWVIGNFDDEQLALERAGRKGHVGALLEAALGADAASLAEPDFVGLGVELKTVSVDASARPLGTTWVCVAPLDGRLPALWEESWVRRKLAKVLFVPVVGAKGSPVGTRRIGAPVLWTPSAAEEAVLRQDYDEIVELITLGAWDRLTGSVGEALHVRPKGATSRDTTTVLSADGDWIEIGPKGFYLRRGFIEAILARAFG